MRFERILAVALLLVLPTSILAQVDGQVPAGQDSTLQRSPRGAMVRSLLLPGWGQFYNRRPVKGIFIAAAEMGSAAALVYQVNRSPDPVTGVVPDNRTRLFTLTTAGILFYSVVDAYVDAHLDMVDWGRIEVDPENGRVEAKVRVRW